MTDYSGMHMHVATPMGGLVEGQMSLSEPPHTDLLWDQTAVWVSLAPPCLHFVQVDAHYGCPHLVWGSHMVLVSTEFVPMSSEMALGPPEMVRGRGLPCC